MSLMMLTFRLIDCLLYYGTKISFENLNHFFIFCKKLILFYYTFMRDTITMICEPKLLLAQKTRWRIYTA